MPILIPARNSRHRSACFALYRALFRSARKIPVPSDLGRAHANPIHDVIRDQFQRNRADTSPRLVYAALSAGYKFLALFAKAQVEGSPDHGAIVQHLGERYKATDTAKHNTRSRRGRRAEQSSPSPSAPPLLTRLPDMTGNPDKPPRYTCTIRPLPKSAIRGERKIPRLCVTTAGSPFLRFTKPQPKVLSTKLWRLDKTINELVEATSTIRDDLLDVARDEDVWDQRVRAMLAKESSERNLSSVELDELAERSDATYTNTYDTIRRRIQKDIEYIRKDNIARAAAMLELVRKEKALAESERAAEESGKMAT